MAQTANPPAGESTQKRSSYGYKPELDAVRFLAFLLVFFHHVVPREGGPRFVNVIGNSFGMGLCLFFTLSAYLITNLLLRERQAHGVISVRKFYIRRILRIWPLYILGISIGIVIALARHNHAQAIGFLWFFLLAGNFVAAAIGWNPMSVLWSISLEEQFYLIWPWAMRFLSRRGLAICAFVFIAAANIALFVFGQAHVDTDAVVWYNTFVQFEMFATGILLALAPGRKALNRPVLGCSLVLTGPVLWYLACSVFRAKQPPSLGFAISGPHLIAGYAIIALGCAAVLLGFNSIGPERIPRWVAELGKISFGLYVYHRLAMASVAHIPGHFLALEFLKPVLSLALTILIAKLSYTWLESPFLRLKNRFEVVQSRPV